MIEHIPKLQFIDTINTSKTNNTTITKNHTNKPNPNFTLKSSTIILNHNNTNKTKPNKKKLLTQTNYIPLNYYKNTQKTQTTFPIINNIHYSIPNNQTIQLNSNQITILNHDNNYINSNNKKIYPKKIEQILKNHSTINNILVTKIPNNQFNQKIKTIITLHTKTSTSSNKLNTYLHKHLTNYKIPHQ